MILMRWSRPLLLCVLAGLSAPLAVVASGCENDGPIVPTGEPTVYDLADPVVTIPAKVAPGAPLEVKVDAKNASDGVWYVGSVGLGFAGDEAWGDGTLVLQEQSLSGEPASFGGTLTAPAVIGKHTLIWQADHAGEPFGPQIEAETLVTCDDGVFCNGTERFAGGACVAGAAPCDDGAACTKDACDDATGVCSHSLGDDCQACFSDCVPDCTGKVCGDDGCGASCGTCGDGLGCAAATGVCKPKSQPGTCTSPMALLADGAPLIGSHEITGDTTAALHEAVPTCNSTSTAVELVYTFTVAEKVGMDARSYLYDTVLHIRKEDPGTPGSECTDDAPAATVGCSDDASPPGDYGSRVAVALDPGTYYLIVDGFDASQFGPFALDVKFVADGCVPACDGLYCGGDDGCGENCGTCDAGFACSEGRCEPDPCVPQCDGKVCGDDGCKGSCGECAEGELCVPANGQCKVFPVCDHDVPACEPACKDSEFCGTDCECHDPLAKMPDLVLNAQRLKDEILFDSLDVAAGSCTLAEACVGGMGTRKLLRFSVEAINQGQATLTVPPPDERPDLFGFSSCHGHYHFGGFATYYLLDKEGNVVLEGRKQAYCMEDTVQVHQGPDVACSKVYDCFNQGIQAGWSDLYGNALDCQWLDITDVAAGDYQLQVQVNPGHAFEEVSFDNNTATVDVTIK